MGTFKRVQMLHLAAGDDVAAGVEHELGEHLVSNNGDFCEKYISIR